MLLARASHVVRTILTAVTLAAVAPAIALAVPYTWAVPMGGETWGTGHVHTLLWSGGPANPTNIYLIHVPSNTVAQVVALNTVNDGEVQFRLNSGLAPGPYLFYIEDNIPTEWTYGPEIQIRETPACIAPCTQGSFGAPLTVCGQTQAEAESLAIALAQSHISCGMAGNVVPGSVSIETTLINVGGYPCPAPYGGAYAVEVSAVWCCCHEPTDVEGRTWSGIKVLLRDDTEQ
ncbi:MAG TPA: hypothetical protein VF720_13020 [Candidatus Eisenbacteria bacterium]